MHRQEVLFHSLHSCLRGYKSSCMLINVPWCTASIHLSSKQLLQKRIYNIYVYLYIYNIHVFLYALDVFEWVKETSLKKHSQGKILTPQIRFNVKSLLNKVININHLTIAHVTQSPSCTICISFKISVMETQSDRPHFLRMIIALMTWLWDSPMGAVQNWTKPMNQSARLISLYEWHPGKSRLLLVVNNRGLIFSKWYDPPQDWAWADPTV